MRNIYLVFFLFISSNIRGQKLVIDSFDATNNSIVKETNWNNISNKDGSRLRIKISRINETIKIYYTLKENKDNGSCDSDNIIFFFTNNDSLKINLADFTVELISNDNRSYNKSDISRNSPHGISSPPLTRDDLSILQNHYLKAYEICSMGRKHHVEIKEKNKDIIKKCIELIR